MSTTRETFEIKLKEIQENLLIMGTETETMLYNAIDALVQRNPQLADEVIKKDDFIDNLNIEIENKCLNLLALQQPMARDLRFIAGVLKIITDIERIADYSVDIAKFVKQIIHEPIFKPLVDIPKMANLVKKMLHESLEGFVNRDLEKIKEMIEDDDKVDTLHRYLFNELLDFMEKDSKLVRQTTFLLLITRFLERIADHITNIGERVYYMETGELKELHI